MTNITFKKYFSHYFLALVVIKICPCQFGLLHEDQSHKFLLLCSEVRPLTSQHVEKVNSSSDFLKALQPEYLKPNRINHSVAPQNSFK